MYHVKSVRQLTKIYKTSMLVRQRNTSRSDGLFRSPCQDEILASGLEKNSWFLGDLFCQEVQYFGKTSEV